MDRLVLKSLIDNKDKDNVIIIVMMDGFKFYLRDEDLELYDEYIEVYINEGYYIPYSSINYVFFEREDWQ